VRCLIHWRNVAGASSHVVDARTVVRQPRRAMRKPRSAPPCGVCAIIPRVSQLDRFDFETPANADDAKGVSAHFGGRSYRVLCAEAGTPDVLRKRVADLQARGLDVALSSRFRMDAALEAHLRAERLDYAIGSLFRRQPACSAAGTIWIWQIIAAAIAVGLIIGGFSVLPHATIAALSGIIAVPFLCVTLLRVVALREVIASPRKEMRRQRPGIASLPQTLPHYTVMVPLLAGWARRYLRCTHMGSAMLLDS
jgi:hypothetical protein